MVIVILVIEIADTDQPNLIVLLKEMPTGSEEIQHRRYTGRTSDQSELTNCVFLSRESSCLDGFLRSEKRTRRPSKSTAAESKIGPVAEETDGRPLRTDHQSTAVHR